MAESSASTAISKSKRRRQRRGKGDSNNGIPSHLGPQTSMKCWNDAASAEYWPKKDDKVMVMVQGQTFWGHVINIFIDHKLGGTHWRLVAVVKLCEEYENLLSANGKFGEKYSGRKRLFVRVCNCRPFKEDMRNLTTSLEKGTAVEISTKLQKSYGIVTGWELSTEQLHEDFFVLVDMDQTFEQPEKKQSPRYDRIKKFPIGLCRPDRRFEDTIPEQQQLCMEYGTPHLDVMPQSCNIEHYIPPILELNDNRLLHLNGEWKGIQGNYNSCYLDTTLFSMFLFTDAFDSILQHSEQTEDIALMSSIKTVLREEIVYPLRQTLFVSQDKVMKLRGLLQSLDKSLKGFETAQKDAEEFLEFFLQHALQSYPLLEFTSGQTSYCYQLFVDKSEGLQLNTVQSLVSQSLLATNTQFQQMPNCIFLLMPRHGSKFKTYDRIFPSKTIDIGDFVKDEPKMCYVCGEASDIVCKECRANNWDPFIPAGFYCSEHVKLVHSHPDRQHHRHEICEPNINGTVPVPYEMELQAVWCIETSHYIAFVKCGSDETSNWYFFDSMAQRIDYKEGFNVPEVTECNELNEWLTSDGYYNMVNNSKQIPDKVKRLMKDIYICMYVRKPC